MRSFDEVKQDVLSQIEHVASARCDSTVATCSLRRRENMRSRTKGGSCPGAKSVFDDVKDVSSLQELKDNLDNLMCVQTMFGHILKEGK
ncbi:MAG: hypothetical protein CEO40_194 [Parcubacteria group bacterium LiPW_72]|nr:MAG: hypothetical protein CEO40_194 [Parcubacteria group bacterium LiPW_72]